MTPTYAKASAGLKARLSRNTARQTRRRSSDAYEIAADAAGRCPPEDVGGAPGYAEYLDAIGDPAHPEHEQMRLGCPEDLIPKSLTGRSSTPPSMALSGIWKPRRRK